VIVVVRDSMINAMCLPAGKIVFFTGLLDKLKDEVATVLGHEVAGLKKLCCELLRVPSSLDCLEHGGTIVGLSYGPSWALYSFP
jgi:hypothetical protein